MPHSKCRTGLVAAAALVTGLGLAACGADEPGTASSASTAAARRPAPPQTVTITASGREAAPTFAVSGSARPGAAKVVLRNELAKGESDGQLIYLAEDHPDGEVVAELRKAMSGKAVADWFKAGGGPGSADAGGTASVTQELEAGTYVVAAGEGEPARPLARIEVRGEDGPAFEPPNGSIIATEYAFRAEGAKAGAPVLLRNAGRQWHHFLAARLKAGATVGDVKRYLKTEKGKAPFAAEENALESTVLEGGDAQVVDLFEKPGRYAVFCFLADKQGGPPHVVKGMVSEVVVR